MRIIKIKAIPKSRISRVIEEDNNSYRVKVDAAPEKGKANKRLIELLAEYFGIPKSKISILKGEFSSFKTVSVDDSERKG